MADQQTHMCAPCAAGLYEECLNPKAVEDEGELWIIPCAVEFIFDGGVLSPDALRIDGKEIV